MDDTPESDPGCGRDPAEPSHLYVTRYDVSGEEASVDTALPDGHYLGTYPSGATEPPEWHTSHRSLLILLTIPWMPTAGVAQVAVENSLASSWTTVTEWTLEEDLRLWGPPGGYFGTIGSLAADSRDNIYVLDVSSQEVQVFDSEGALLRTLGGAGEGPGEFRFAAGPAVGPGDTVWVADGMSRRYSIFGPDGTFLRVKTRRINQGQSPERCTFGPDGTYREWAMRFPNEERSGDFSDIDLVHYHPVQVSPHGDTQDTLPRLEFTQQMAEIPSRGLRRPVFFGPSLEFALDCADGLWFVHTDEYKLFRRTLAGDTTVVATLDGPRPAEVDEADRDWVRAVFERRPNPPLVADHLRALPARKPIIVEIFVDGAGHVFVIPETSMVDAGQAIDVLREDGVFLGRLSVPATVKLTPKGMVHATEDYMLFAGEDDAGTPYVTRLRIRR